MSTQETSSRAQMRHSRSMDMGVVRTIDTSQQMEEVKALILSSDVFNTDTVTTEVEWFYGPLGIHDFYFLGQSPLVIAQHIQSLIAAKLMSKASNRPDVKLEQESANGAFFAVLSNVVGSANEPSRRAARYDAGITETEVLERRLEKHYLSGSSGVIGDGVKAGYQYLEKAEATKKRTYRMQCYRSSGVLDPVSVPYHVRMYFLQEPQFADPSVSKHETDINKIADKVFLERSGSRLKDVYQECIIKAMAQMTPAFHAEVWTEVDGSKMARLAIAYRSGATHSYFSSIADVYRQHGLFSQRKYAEFFANGIVIYTFYLQMLDNPTAGKGSFEDRLKAVVNDASMHFTLPRTSLTPMLTDGLLTPQQIAYAYAAWKFTFHFMRRLPESFAIVSKSLRDRDPSAFARLEQLRSTMKLNTYTESQILDHILSSADIVKLLYAEFQALHEPNKDNKVLNVETSATLSTLRKSIVAEQALQIFSLFHVFNKHIRKTNFFANDKAALSFRLDGKFLSKTEFPDEPHAIIYVIGSEFRGFHVRFLDVARGGIRMIRSSHAQVYLDNASSLFDECYGLASTQHRKNKDIPEGGSKGVVLLNQAHQDKADVAFRKYIDAVLDLMLMKEPEEDILFLGPDEGTAHLMDWASSHARQRGYSYWKAITTGKSASRGGIPHDVYGMTTHSVREYVLGIQRKLQLQAPITKVQTGGPDGDLGSNEIKMSPQEETIAIVDGSGVLYDPKGINREDLLKLAEERSPVSGFDTSKLSSDGYLVLVSHNDITLPSGDVVENGTEFRNFFHLRPDLTADFFVPCGGRPAAVNLNNVEQFMYCEDGRTLRFKYIVEGANLFFTQDARSRLEEAGVILFKDASANKGGVTSSSLEVLAALSMTDEEFAEHMQVDEATGKPPAFYADYVSEVQKRIELNAQREFECIWREHERTGTHYSVLTNQLSERITNLSAKIQDSALWDNTTLRGRIFADGFPDILLRKTPQEELLKRLPESYTRAFFASQLASRLIYSVGLSAPEFSFYEFIQELVSGE
uniref:Glutamate/phenylalanine/leucine/valine/L-tryptophan dehydrogenase C-terminal domain-containing protein n=1 Tax=Hyaloperonospora arabidopsidis (strain Emoy2) TaxID=559515 RepID=M4BZ98_HYAAE